MRQFNKAGMAKGGAGNFQNLEQLMRRAVENPGVAVYFTSNPAAGHSTPGRLDQNQLQHTAAMQQPHNFRSLAATSIISRPQRALVSNS